jgi:E3 ubiquitin-protein ligase MYCBP2
MFLAADGDHSYMAQCSDVMSPEVKKASAFPTAASVFGTSQQSVFSPPVPPVFQFGSSKPIKLQFGSQESLATQQQPSPTPGPFKFGSTVSADRKNGKNVEDGAKPKMAAVQKISGVLKARVPPRFSRRRRRSQSPIKGPQQESGEEIKEEIEEKSEAESSPEEKEEEKPPPVVAAKSATITKQALSPAVAECQRAIFAAFLWQENLVYDAMASATFLKFRPELTKEFRQDLTSKEAENEKEKVDDEVGKKQEVVAAPEGREIAPPAGGGEGGATNREVEKVTAQENDKSSSDGKIAEVGKEKKTRDDKVIIKEGDIGVEWVTPSASETALVKKESDAVKPLLPPTLSHLVTFWDEISTKVTESSSLPFPAPKVPSLAQDLQSRYEQEKKEIEKRKKDKDKKAPTPAGGGSTTCELCDQSFPDPVTYHMKDVHPGCGKHANGWGYNSRGTFCSGWAGNCGDGGRGGSTWYLLCKDCHARYMAMKDDARKKVVKSVPLPKAKTRKPGKPRSLPIVSSIPGMIQNAKFLLEISRSCESAPPTPQQKSPSVTELTSGSGDLLRQSSTPLVENVPSMDKPPGIPRDLRVDTANTSSDSTLVPAKRPPYLRSVSEAVRPADPPLQKSSIDLNEVDSPVFCQPPLEESPDHSSSFMLKPSRNLRQLIYRRSRSSVENKDMGYRKVMAFVSAYHDLEGLRVSMKQSMRVAGLRTFAMEVSFLG